MKKIFAAMLIACVSTTVFAYENLVYDYKASIKRIEYVLNTKKFNKATYVAQAYKPVSDTIIGYVVIPSCKTCSNGVLDESLNAENTNTRAIGLFKRSGDKFAPKGQSDKDLFVTRDTNVYVASAMFGAYTFGDEATGAKGRPIDNNKYAWMKLAYLLGADGNTIQSTLLLKKYQAMDVDYAFLGATNVDAGQVVNTGFGTIKSDSTKDVTTTTICGSEVIPGKTCTIINSITGTLVGGNTENAMDNFDPEYMGLCEVTPMWDICSVEQVEKAVICGTWTLKYNEKLTKTYTETLLLQKLGATEVNVFDAL